MTSRAQWALALVCILLDAVLALGVIVDIVLPKRRKEAPCEKPKSSVY